MSSESEEDYMAGTFVTEPATTTIRPGLIHSRVQQRNVQVAAQKRRHDDEYKAAGRSKLSMRQLESETREAGMQKALPADNKGFAMLARMGYKAGQSLGRSSATTANAIPSVTNARPTGILEPIGIQLKNDRAGLGRDVAMQQLREQRDKLRREKLLRFAAGKEAPLSTDEYRRRMTQKAQERQLEADLGKCQRACEKLDLEESIEKPAMLWFWPIRETSAKTTDNESDEEATKNDSDNSENEEEECVYETSEKLDILGTYLRTTYCYCHWCGTRYDDGDDLRKSCPGETKDDH